jgi:hypothetical protein
VSLFLSLPPAPCLLPHHLPRPDAALRARHHRSPARKRNRRVRELVAMPIQKEERLCVCNSLTSSSSPCTTARAGRSMQLDTGGKIRLAEEGLSVGIASQNVGLYNCSGAPFRRRFPQPAMSTQAALSGILDKIHSHDKGPSLRRSDIPSTGCSADLFLEPRFPLHGHQRLADGAPEG